MKFRVKDMHIATGGTLIVILNEKDAHQLDLRSGDRIIVKRDHKEITCILDLSHSHKTIPEGKIGLFEEVLQKLGVQNGAVVDIKLTGKPESIIHIKDKLQGKNLTSEDFYHIMDDIAHDRLTGIEKTYFVAACYIRGLTMREIVDLTKAMVNTGEQLKFKGMVLDKHSIGGVPGNRTSMIIVPIIAAAGFTIPKTSSRAITSAAGTADTMECLAKVDLPETKIKKVILKTKGCIVHGGAINLAPADDKIIEVEHPLSIDAEGQLLASVMAKKYSAGGTHVLIDIPMGKNSKVSGWKDAEHLRTMFKILGAKLGMKVKIIITDGSQPVGNGVGPLLEAEDILKVLHNDPAAPVDLKIKSLLMAGALLEMTGKFNRGFKAAKEILESGKAWKKFSEIMNAQGKVKKPALGKFMFVIKSTTTGMVKEIDNEIIAKVARIAGAPDDKGAGLYLHKKVHEMVNKGEKLYTIYAKSKFKLNLAKELAEEKKGYVVG